MYDHDLDRRIEHLAQRQCGAFNLDQLRRAGGDTDAAAHRIELGRWGRLAPAVFVVSSFPGTFERQCWAAVLGEPEAAVGGLAGAHVLGFDGFRPGHPEIVVPVEGNGRSELATIHRYADAATTKIRGLPVTTPAQTLFDVASRISVDRLERTADNLLVGKRLSVDDLDERLHVYNESRRAGLPRMRLLISERRAGGFVVPVSDLERRGDRILRKLSGRPRIEAEVSFSWLERGNGRVDRYLGEDGTIVEFDGRRWHTRVQDFDKDLWRDNKAQAEGLALLRFTWAHITLAPAEVLEIIERTRATRRRQRVA